MEDRAGIEAQLAELESYFAARYPGQKDVPEVQALKSMCREWEAECIWGYFGWDCANVKHLRLGFYTGDIFTEEPTVEGDVLPVLELLDQVEPDVVSVALIRATRGLVFIKEMDVGEFYERSRALKQAAENR